MSDSTIHHRQLKREHVPTNEPRRLPLTRADCSTVHRPCPYVSCRQNLYLDVTEGGGLKFNFPGLEPDEVGESCALDVADRGAELSADDVGRIVGVTRQGIQRTEQIAFRKMRLPGNRPPQ